MLVLFNFNRADSVKPHQKIFDETLLLHEAVQKSSIVRRVSNSVAWNIEVGDSVIGYGALLDGRSGIRIDDHVCLAVGVSIYTLQHDVNDEHFAVNQKGGSVEIEKYAWISSHTTVLPKVHVGEGCVLAAGGIATKNLEPYGVYAGIPARRISERNRCLHYTVGDTYCHFY